MLTQADRPVLRFDDLLQEWQLITPVVMPTPQLAITLNYCREVYRKRLQGELGPRRRRMEEALSKLSTSTVKQFCIGKGEKILYHAGKL